MSVLARTIFFDSVKTPLGLFQIAATERGLVQINFPKHHRPTPRQQKIQGCTKGILKSTKIFLSCFLAGRGNRYPHIPIDWDFFAPFDRRVLKTLMKVPQHRTVISYSELARRSGAPRAARAVGSALNRNPIPILIPCHRVVRKDRVLGGYGAGIRWKKMLLNLDKKLARRLS